MKTSSDRYAKERKINTPERSVPDLYPYRREEKRKKKQTNHTKFNRKANVGRIMGRERLSTIDWLCKVKVSMTAHRDAQKAP